MRNLSSLCLQGKCTEIKNPWYTFLLYECVTVSTVRCDGFSPFEQQIGLWITEPNI